MLRSKLFEILTMLNPKAFSQFSALAKVGFVNTNNDGQLLLDYISKYRKNEKFVGKDFEKEIVQNRLFQQGEKGDAALRRAMYNLKIGLEEYLALEELKTQDSLKQELLHKTFQKKKLYKHAEKVISSRLTTLKKASSQNNENFYEIFKLKQKAYFDPSKEIVNQNFSTLNAVMENLDAFYFQEKFQIAVEMLERQTVLGEKFEIPLIDPCLDDANLRINHNYPAYRIYKNLIEIHLKGFEIKKYKESLNILFSEHKNISETDGYKIFLYLQNIQIRLHKQGDPKAVHLIHANYSIALKAGILLENGSLRPTTFINIVITACLAKELKWVKKFIETRGNGFLYLDEGIQSLLNEAWIQYYFHKADYSEVRNRFIEYKFPRNFYSFRMKTILIRTYYELQATTDGMWELLDHEIENFYRYLRKSKKSSDQKTKGFNNFINILKRLISKQRKGKLTPQAKKDLINAINKKSEMPIKEWLIAKIELS